MEDIYINFDRKSQEDTHWALRGRFRLSTPGRVRFSMVGGGWYEVCQDGEFLLEGPERFDVQRPEYQQVERDLPAGDHVLAIHWHDLRLTTRLLLDTVPSFLRPLVEVDGQVLETTWRARRLDGYQRTRRRLGCVLGWVEWVDTSTIPADWQAAGFDDRDWEILSPSGRPKGLGELLASGLAPMRHTRRKLHPAEQGELVNMSMIDHDPTMNFFIRERGGSDLPPNGVWWRFDLGFVQLGRPEITLDLPGGSLVQVGYAESLTHGRVSPYLKSGGGRDSCMLDTWFARGGRQTFHPLHPKGARFLEVHVLAEPREVKWIDGSFIERHYYPEEPDGTFHCDDDALNRIWSVGVRTLQSCAEDAITDNPTRERGQWLGDAVGPGMDIVACAFRDHRPLVRGLRQAALCANKDGLIPAIFPGTRQYLPSFAIQWIASIPAYYRLSGDHTILEDLFDPAWGIVESFQPDRVRGGIKRNNQYWNFVDWGYVGAASQFNGKNDEETLDPAISLFYLRALRSLDEWSRMLGNNDGTASRRACELETEIRDSWLEKFHPDLGYHATTLALRENLLSSDERPLAIRSVKQHLLDCFPNNPEAPRLADTRVESPRLITPFFLHFTLPVLIEQGESTFVYEQIKACWNWMLEEGATTWYEVFDPRWSHCHQWSGCPTWILSRYALGLEPRLDLGPAHYILAPRPGNLSRANGRIPLPRGGTIAIQWNRIDQDTLDVSIQSDTPLHVQSRNGTPLFDGKTWNGILQPPAKVHPNTYNQ